MSSENAIIILDSDEEEEEIKIAKPKPQQQQSKVYTTIVIDSDDEEEAKNKRLEAIVMNNVQKKQQQQQPGRSSANVNKLFQKDTRITNIKKNGVKPRKTQVSSSSSIDLSQIDKSFETQPSLEQDDSFSSIDMNDIDFNFSINSQSSQTSTTTKKSQESPIVPVTKKQPQQQQIPEEVEDLEYYISFFNQKRKRRSESNIPSTKSTNMQCPICYLLFPKAELIDHASGCDGKKTSNGKLRKSISAAVLLEQQEREKRRKGVQEVAPTNYYMDGDIVSTTGAGFNNEVGDGLNWESAGQTRFG